MSETSRGQLLVASADRLTRPRLLAALRRKGFEVTAATADSDIDGALEGQRFDLLLLDLDLPDDSAARCAELAAERPLMPLVVVTEQPQLDEALGALRAGAYDYLTWPMPVDALSIALDRAIQHRRLRRELRRLRRALKPSDGFGGLIGDSPPMRSVLSLMERVRNSVSSVLVTGETGTGKEVVARALHQAGKRSGGPFVAVHCAAVPEALLESELFGHVRGAFTDARSARKGLFLEADGGTLFLDELGEMPLKLQVKLLRALQERTVRPVGSDREIPFDVRLIAATNRDLEAMVAEGSFRQDLFYRVNVIHLELPPLRARGADILTLAEHFLRAASLRAETEVAGFSEDAARRLLDYPWPGNIRELENAIERSVALAGGDQIEVEDLPLRVQEHRASHIIVASQDPEELVSLRTVEERYILRVLAATAGKRAQAARILGIDRKSLYRKLKSMGVEGG